MGKFYKKSEFGPLALGIPIGAALIAVAPKVYKSGQNIEKKMKDELPAQVWTKQEANNLFYNSRLVDAVDTFKSYPKSRLDKPTEVIFSLDALRKALKKENVGAIRRALISLPTRDIFAGYNAAALSEKDFKKNYVVLGNPKISEETLYHELGHLRPGHLTDEDLKKFRLFDTTGRWNAIIKEEEGAWEEAGKYTNIDTHHLALNSYRNAEEAFKRSQKVADRKVAAVFLGLLGTASAVGGAMSLIK